MRHLQHVPYSSSIAPRALVHLERPALQILKQPAQDATLFEAAARRILDQLRMPAAHYRAEASGGPAAAHKEALESVREAVLAPCRHVVGDTLSAAVQVGEDDA